jgi:predicted nuclease of predicted toxin-antitoxin system
VKVLLDHCLDWRLQRHLAGHEVRHVGKLGWGALKNGELLARAAESFDAFVTSDKNLPRQQNLSRFPLAVIILDVPTNTIEDCLCKVAELLRVLPLAPRGRATVI